MSLRSNAVGITPTIPPLTQKAVEANLIEVSKQIDGDTLVDITDRISLLGLDPEGDIIFNGTDCVAVQQHHLDENCNKLPQAKVMLKITKDADLGTHHLQITGQKFTSGFNTITLIVKVK